MILYKYDLRMVAVTSEGWVCFKIISTHQIYNFRVLYGIGIKYNGKVQVPVSVKVPLSKIKLSPTLHLL